MRARDQKDEMPQMRIRVGGKAEGHAEEVRQPCMQKPVLQQEEGEDMIMYRIWVRMADDTVLTNEMFETEDSMNAAYNDLLAKNGSILDRLDVADTVKVGKD